MQVGNWVAEESAKGQERKMVKAEARQWNYYYFSAAEETELKMPCELVGGKKIKNNNQEMYGCNKYQKQPIKYFTCIIQSLH